MLALLPVRAMAAVTGFCAFAHEHGAAATEAAHAHDVHGKDAPKSSHGKSPCSSCVEHCSSAAFAPAVTAAVFARPSSSEPFLLHERSVAGFIADHLDPPPLAA